MYLLNRLRSASRKVLTNKVQAALFGEISSELKGKPVAPLERMRKFDRHFRILGWQRLIGMADLRP